MTPLEQATLEAIVSSTTNHPVDRQRAVAALVWADQRGIRDEALSFLMERRRMHIAWLTVTQRKWQSNVSRRPQRGRHHDSWSIREQYVRCT